MDIFKHCVTKRIWMKMIHCIIGSYVLLAGKTEDHARTQRHRPRKSGLFSTGPQSLADYPRRPGSWQVLCHSLIHHPQVREDIFWNVTPYSLVEVYIHFRGMYCLHLQF
jgi:hypothetical protein